MRIENNTLYSVTEDDLVNGMFEFPKGITEIGEDAFINCTSLKNIAIQEGVTSIGDKAFYHCTSLESITIPDSVTSMGNDAFWECTSLESVVLPSSIEIAQDAFKGCPFQPPQPTTSTATKKASAF